VLQCCAGLAECLCCSDCSPASAPWRTVSAVEAWFPVVLLVARRSTHARFKSKRTGVDWRQCAVAHAACGAEHAAHLARPLCCRMYKTRAQFRAKQAGVDLNEVKGGLQPNRQGTGAATRPQDVIVSDCIQQAAAAVCNFCPVAQLASMHLSKQYGMATFCTWASGCMCWACTC
jgi:hypothetical protein